MAVFQITAFENLHQLASISHYSRYTVRIILTLLALQVAERVIHLAAPSQVVLVAAAPGGRGCVTTVSFGHFSSGGCCSLEPIIPSLCVCLCSSRVFTKDILI